MTLMLHSTYTEKTIPIPLSLLFLVCVRIGCNLRLQLYSIK